MRSCVDGRVKFRISRPINCSVFWASTLARGRRSSSIKKSHLKNPLIFIVVSFLSLLPFVSIKQFFHVILKVMGKLGVSVSYETLPVGNNVGRRTHDTEGLCHFLVLIIDDRKGETFLFHIFPYSFFPLIYPDVYSYKL